MQNDIIVLARLINSLNNKIGDLENDCDDLDKQICETKQLIHQLENEYDVSVSELVKSILEQEEFPF